MKVIIHDLGKEYDVVATKGHIRDLQRTLLQ